MRRWLGLIGLVVLLVAQSAWAGQVTLTWPPVIRASSYRIYQSVDDGQTWTLAHTAYTTAATITVPDNVLVLLRLAAVNQVGEVIQTRSGVWYRSDWRP